MTLFPAHQSVVSFAPEIILTLLAGAKHDPG